MGHKVHPKCFRIRGIEDWDSRGFYKNYPMLLEEDFKIRRFLKEKIGQTGLEKVEIERFPGKILVIIFSARPGLLIGRGGEGVEMLRKSIEKMLGITVQKSKEKSEDKKDLKIEIREVKNPWLSATLAGQWVAQQLEKRAPFRGVLKQSISKVMANREAQGVKVEVSGRLNGSEIARREWLKEGRLPLQTLRADVDFARVEALCTYGKIGIKVWIYKGEKFK
jgi:small subunit ribosomal protein S3